MRKRNKTTMCLTDQQTGDMNQVKESQAKVEAEKYETQERKRAKY